MEKQRIVHREYDIDKRSRSKRAGTQGEGYADLPDEEGAGKRADKKKDKTPPARGVESKLSEQWLGNIAAKVPPGERGAFLDFLRNFARHDYWKPALHSGDAQFKKIFAHFKWSDDLAALVEKIEPEDIAAYIRKFIEDAADRPA